MSTAEHTETQQRKVRSNVYSTRPLIFQASTGSRNSPSILYTSNTSNIESGEGFNLSYLVNDDSRKVAGHHAQLEQALGKPLALLHQVHSSRVIDLDDYFGSFHAQTTPQSGNAREVRKVLEQLATEEADAQVSTSSDIALGVYTADCTPVLFSDAQRGVYGSAHAGRKGVQNGIVLRVLEMMQKKGAQINDIEIWLGPNICGNCYETGEQVAQEFEAANETLVHRAANGNSAELPRASSFIGITRFGGLGVDMRRALLAQLSIAGIRGSHIHDADPSLAKQTQQYVGEGNTVPVNPMCTLENPKLFSYREWSLTHKEGSNGRFISVLLP